MPAPNKSAHVPFLGTHSSVEGVSTALFGKTRRAILALMFNHPEQSFYLRQIARYANTGMGAVQRELQLLTQARILNRNASGGQVYFQANSRSPIFNDLRNLVTKTAGVGDPLKEALQPFQDRINVAFVYGSYAKNNVNEASDLDVMVIGEVTFAEIVSALNPLQDSIGREINPSVFPKSEYKEKISAGHHFLKTVLSDEKFFLIGDMDDLAKLAE